MPGTGSSNHPGDGVPSQATGMTAPYLPVAEKSLAVAYLLWFFLGWLGIHQFYLGKVGRGVGYVLTAAWFFIAWWVDLFTLPAQVKRVNFEHQVGLR